MTKRVPNPQRAAGAVCLLGMLLLGACAEEVPGPKVADPESADPGMGEAWVGWSEAAEPEVDPKASVAALGTELEYALAKISDQDTGLCNRVGDYRPWVRVVSDPEDFTTQVADSRDLSKITPITWYDPGGQGISITGPSPTGAGALWPEIPEGVTALEFYPGPSTGAVGFVILGVFDSGGEWVVAVRQQRYGEGTADEICFLGVVYVQAPAPGDVKIRTDSARRSDGGFAFGNGEVEWGDSRDYEDALTE